MEKEVGIIDIASTGYCAEFSEGGYKRSRYLSPEERWR